MDVLMSTVLLENFKMFPYAKSGGRCFEHRL